MAPDGAVQEILGSAPDRERTGPPRWVLRGAVLLVVVVVGTVAWVTVHRQHERAVGRIDACATAGQSAVGYANARVSGMANYVRVTLSSTPRGPLRDGLFQMVARTAEQSLPSVQDAEDGCSVELHPWLRSAGRAHASYLAYLDEEYRVLASTASDGAEIYRPHPLLDQLRRQARADLERAGATGAVDAVS